MVNAEAEPVLGEEARELARNAIYGEAPAWCADAVVDALEDHIAALVTQARACRALAQWLVALDEPGATERRTVTLNEIVQQARRALDDSGQ